ncbi:MAG: hypothetical protein K2K54_06895, partial [Lachnospiraceae bacterium]|nr:hypothetical protein [Lachnospiraceae bacterium]
VTMTAIVTGMAGAAVTEDVTVMMIATGGVTVTETAIEIETVAVTEARKQDRLPLLQIPADVKKSLFHNRLFSLDK